MMNILSKKIPLLLLMMLSLLLASCSDSAAPIYSGPDIQILKNTVMEDLKAEYHRYSYRLDRLENGVPPLILLTLPKDLPQISSKPEKKLFFFKLILPMILLANEEIRRERDQAESFKQMLDRGQTLTEHQLQIIASLLKRYEVNSEAGELPAAIDALLIRIDIIPPDLALAQAANESAWGTSRFSQMANNLFGEWTFSPGTGMVPEDRPEGATYEVRRFETIYESIRSYLRNLNTHAAYKELRQLRAEARAAALPLDGIKLAEGLFRYSTRGEDYVRELQSLIRQNSLSRFSSVSLRLRS
jgi:Bax protein